MRPIVWLVLFAVYAICEFAVVIWVAAITSWFVVLMLLVVGGVIGAIIMSRAGAEAVNAMAGSVRTASVPAGQVGGHGLTFVSGLLIATPGFISDLVGALLLVPPISRWVQRRLGVSSSKWLRRRGFSTVRVTRPDGTQGSRIAPGDIVEGEILDPDS